MLGLWVAVDSGDLSGEPAPAPESVKTMPNFEFQVKGASSPKFKQSYFFMVSLNVSIDLEANSGVIHMDL